MSDIDRDLLSTCTYLAEQMRSADTKLKAPKKIDTSTIIGSKVADDLVEKMVASVPHKERHAWLLAHEWKFVGTRDPHHTGSCRSQLTGHLEGPGPCDCGAKRMRDYGHERLGGPFNQTTSIRKAAWGILEKKGLLVR